MNKVQSRDAARELLKIIPLVMRTVAAALRAAGELPAPAHFGLLSMVSQQPRPLSELAHLQGVSLPTMSNSVAALVQRGWLRRTTPLSDRRVVVIELTNPGRAALDRVARCAETHLATVLAPLDAAARRRLSHGLGVLRRVFSEAPAINGRSRPGRRERTEQSGRR